MPRYSVVLPILLPTLYLWECDARALQRGTWVIEQGTKLGLSYRGLEIECVKNPVLVQTFETDAHFRSQRGCLLLAHESHDRVWSRRLVSLNQ
jgi:hypothetical protein